MSQPFCKDCEFFIPSEDFKDEYHNIKFGLCSKAPRAIANCFKLVTGVKEPVKISERFFFAKSERQYGNCGWDGHNFKSK